MTTAAESNIVDSVTQTLSVKQLAANQANASKSTGPRTPEGRAASKMNALKHGILSRQVLVRGRNLNESPRELAALHARFWEALQPVGPVEEMLVDQIVTTHWRWRRALTAESGEIALSVDEGEWKRSQDPSTTAPWLEWGLHGDPFSKMKDSAVGNSLIQKWLTEVRKAVELEGELTETALKKFISHFGGQPNSLTRELEAFRLQQKANTDGLEAGALRERNQLQALAFLDEQLGSLSWQITTRIEREQKEEEARQAAAVLPSLDKLEKITRYETKLERQWYRALGQLERLQRRRQGEALPAPVAILT